MKALVYTGPKGLELRDVRPPEPKAGEVLLRVECVGICGSDMHAYLGHDERRPPPLILGHEVAGVADGDAVRRVTVNPLVTCGACHACRSGRDNICPDRQIISMPPREGGFAEQVAIPEQNLVDLPDHVSAEQAALTEPIACGWHAVRIARAHPVVSDDAQAMVIGGGAIGLGAALCLRAQGIDSITMVEPNEIRRRFLQEQCGQDVVEPKDVPFDAGFDVVVDGVGIAATRAQASAAARPGGIIVHIGLGDAEGGLDIRRMTLQEVFFVGTYAYTAQDFRDTAQAIFAKRLGTLDWVETRPLSDGAAAFEDIRSGRSAAPKILLKPDA